MHIKLFALKQYVYSTYMYAFTFYLYLKLSIILFKIYGKDFKEEGMQIYRIIQVTLSYIYVLFFYLFFISYAIKTVPVIIFFN